MAKSDQRIDEYIQKLPDLQRGICEVLREIIHDSDPEIQETIKRTDRPYFTLKGNVCALQATKDHVNLFIYDPIAEDKEGVINQGIGNHTARSIQIYKDDEINEKGITSLLNSVIANNRAGGWRRM
ncbi:MAG: DUF1801 domain-containing protein [Candidatus Microsaccharimonas sp.]